MMTHRYTELFILGLEFQNGMLQCFNVDLFSLPRSFGMFTISISVLFSLLKNIKSEDIGVSIINCIIRIIVVVIMM